MESPFAGCAPSFLPLTLVGNRLIRNATRSALVVYAARQTHWRAEIFSPCLGIDTSVVVVANMLSQIWGNELVESGWLQGKHLSATPSRLRLARCSCGVFDCFCCWLTRLRFSE